MAKTAQKPGHNWYSKAEICAFQGIAEQSFDRTYRPHIPGDAIQKIGARVWFHGPKYFEMVIQKNLTEAKPVDAAGDPLLSGGDSVFLEEYRKQKARIAKVEADEVEKIVVRVDKLKPSLMSAMALIRRAGEALERRFGSEAAGILVEAIDEAVSNIRKLFNDDAGSSDACGDSVGSEADASPVNA